MQALMRAVLRGGPSFKVAVLGAVHHGWWASVAVGVL